MSKYYIKPAGSGVPTKKYITDKFIISNNIWLGGNYYYNETNEDLVTNLESALADIVDSFDEIYFSPNSITASDIDEEDMSVVIKNTIRTSFEAYFENSKCQFTTSELIKIFNFVDNYGDIESDKQDMLNMYCAILEILNKESFITGKMHDSTVHWKWLYYICPKRLEYKLPYIEAIFFGTGMEYYLDKTPHNHIEEFDKDKDDIFTAYTELSDEQDVKKWAAKLIHCNAADIEILPKDWGEFYE